MSFDVVQKLSLLVQLIAPFFDLNYKCTIFNPINAVRYHVSLSWYDSWNS